MKLSHQHASQGLVGYLRNPVTGEQLHFQLIPGQSKVYLQGVLGDKHLDGMLSLEKVSTDDPNDDVDMQLSIAIPPGPVGENLDVQPLKPPAKRYDIDGMPMIDGPVEAPDAEKATIKEDAPDHIVEVIHTPVEKAQEIESATARKEASDRLAADVDGVLMAPKLVEEKGPEMSAPVLSDPTKVPEIPGMGYDRDPQRHEEEWETQQRALDAKRETLEKELEGTKKKSGKGGKAA